MTEPELPGSSSFPAEDMAKNGRRFRHLGSLLHVTALLSLVSWMSTRPLWPTDLWDHVNYGRHFIRTGLLPKVEPLLPLSNDVMGHSAWGSQWIFAQLEGIPEVGLAALQLAYGLSVSISIGLISTTAARLRDSTVWGIVAGVAFLWVNWQQFVIIRPQLFGVVLFSMTVRLLYSENRLGRQHLAMIAGLFLAWVNLHGSFATGLALLGTYFVGHCIDVFLCRRRADQVLRSSSCRTLAGVFAIAVAASMLNPRGPLVFVDVIRVGLHPNIRSMYEWDPLSLKTEQGRAALATCALALVALYFSPRRKRAAELLPLAAMAILTVLSARMINWYAPLVALVLSIHGSAAIDALIGRRSQARPAAGRRAVLWWCSVIVIAGIGLWRTPLAQQAAFGGNIDHPEQQLSQVTPVSTLRFVQSAPDTFEGLVFVPAEWAGYLMRFGPAKMQPMVNLHVHLIPPDVWQDYIHVIRGGGDWDQILKDYGINVVVTDRSQFGPLIHKLGKHNEFRRIFDDDRVEIFVRKDPDH